MIEIFNCQDVCWCLCNRAN